MKTKNLIFLFAFACLFLFTGCRKEDNITPEEDDAVEGNQPPVINDQTFNVDRIDDDEKIIASVIATDPDNDELVFSMREHPLLEITNDGKITLIAGETLPLYSSYSFTVSVSDGEFTESAAITINVNSGNSKPTISNQEFAVEADIDDEDVIGTVIANDPDGDMLTFSIKEDIRGLFEITESGILSLNPGRNFDLGIAASFQIKIEVSDGFFTANATITINVADVEIEDHFFVTVWSVSSLGEVVLPLYESTDKTNTSYDFSIYWGDGSSAEVTSFNDPDARHTYLSSGTYRVIIDGNLKGFNFDQNDASADYLIDVTQWGNVQLGNDGGVFSNLFWLEGFSATDAPDLSEVTDLSSFFSLSHHFNGQIGHWDVSNVTDMSFLFSYSSFNQSINDWDVSSVIDMDFMFSSSSFNQNINDWDVGNVTGMWAMFSNTSFNQDIGSWDVGNVTDMSGMFSNTPFNQDISDWEVGNVSFMTSMFSNSAFDQDIGEWEVGNVVSMRSMFSSSPFNQDISAWDVSAVIYMNEMFYETDQFDQDLSNWDTSNVTYCDDFIGPNSLMTPDQLPTAGDCF